jgi:alpha-glucosidase (family GH31 glycosyl hydrolase)
MRKAKLLVGIFFAAGILLLGGCRALPPAGKESPQTKNQYTIQSELLKLEVSPNPYSYQLIEKSTGNIILSHSGSAVKLNDTYYDVANVQTIDEKNNSITATLKLKDIAQPANVSFSFAGDDMLEVMLSCEKAQNIKEIFNDQSEHYYGIWERPQGGSIDNRGADQDLIGFPGEPDDNTRAPFYMTSGKYGIYVDTVAFGHYSVANNGTTSFDFDKGQMKYYVIYGPSYEEIMSKYNQMAGPAWMPPDWAFDSIWWKNNDFLNMVHYDLAAQRTISSAQDNVEATANYLQYYQIPASAIWIDRPLTSGEWGWGNMEFDSSDTGFPDAQGMINYLNDKGYELLIWIANRCVNTLKNEGDAKGYFFPGCEDKPAADMRNPEAYNWFKKHLDTFAAMGIKGYKIDRGHQGEHPIWVENENVYLFNKMTAEGQMERHGSDYLIFARNCFNKSRKYVGIWNGDIPADFDGLAYSIKNGLRCGAINFPYFGTDTGGYSEPPNKELFTRWFQFSTYCTMMEVHMDPDRTVWYDEDYPHNESPNLIDIARKQCREHHDLIPYTKSYMYHAHQTGMPVMKQLIFAYPDDSKLYDMWDEYLYGADILVAPILQEGKTTRSVYLPEGQWLNYNDKKTVYTGLSTIEANAPLDVIPLFVKAGAIIPRGDILKSNNNWTKNWKPYLDIEVFPCKGGNSFPYYTGVSVKNIETTLENKTLKVKFDDLGINGNLKIYCSSCGDITLNGRKLNADEGFTYDGSRNLLTIPYSKNTSLEVEGFVGIFDNAKN